MENTNLELKSQLKTQAVHLLYKYIIIWFDMAMRRSNDYVF